MTICRCNNSGQSNFEFEFLGEFENEFKNVLGYESGALVGPIDEKKNQRLKINIILLSHKFVFIYKQSLEKIGVHKSWF